MPRNIDERLSQLRTRRRGTDRLERLSESAAADVVQKSIGLESWQQRQTTKSFTQYALGSMQEVGPDYTQKSLDTATRVGKQLEANLPSHGVSATFQLQGSVPLNVHIRGVSDVDMLTLAASFHTYDSSGSWARAGVYRNPSNRTSVEVITDIRNAAEKVLKAAYPAAKVDCSGAKCIAVSGGSLARPIDVVPSHWHDTTAYQSSGAQHDRGVTILDKKAGRTLENLPFLHIHNVHTVDAAVSGGLKKAIRLTKNVKSDADHLDAAKLPSFDIAALLYHADRTALNRSATYELAALAEAQRFLDWCYRNQAQSTMLMTPDGSRRILNTPAKVAGLLAISNEMDDLAANVAMEQAVQLRFSAQDYLQYRDALNNTYIPFVN